MTSRPLRLGANHVSCWKSPPVCRLEHLRSRHDVLSVHITPIASSFNRRGVKTVTRSRLQDLPQGVLPPLPDFAPDKPSAPSYPPVIQQHLNNVKKFSDCVVLTRVGNFYELYAEQADQYGPLLNLKVARRKTAFGFVSMSGFQYFQLDRYLKLLVQDLNKQVAISEEIRDVTTPKTKTGGALFDRKVTRVISAGTLIDENFMNPYENNFLLAIHIDGRIDHTSQARRTPSRSASSAEPDTQSVGFAWADLSSGDFFVQRTDQYALSSVLARIAPKEILLDRSLSSLDQHKLAAFLGDPQATMTYHESSKEFEAITDWNSFLDRRLTGQEVELSTSEIAAGSLLLDFVQDRLRDMRILLRPPIRRSVADAMQIDKHSLRGLEIKETLKDGHLAGSLLHATRKTVTKSGARLLAQRLVSPSMSLVTIKERLDLISELLHNEGLREDVVALLRRSHDILRLLQRFSAGRGDADDLLGLAKTIDVMLHLHFLISGSSTSREPRDHSDSSTSISANSSAALFTTVSTLDLDAPSRLSKRIEDAIDEEGLNRQHIAEEAEADEVAEFAAQAASTEEGEEGEAKSAKPSRKKNNSTISRETERDIGEIWTMRKSASTTLRRAHGDLEDLIREKTQLANDLRDNLRSSSLTLRWTAQLGHFCHVKGKDCKAEFQGARNISTSKSTRSFRLTAWTDLGMRIDQAKMRIRVEEQRVFSSLRDDVILNLVKLRRNAMVLDELDVACSSAIVAKEKNHIRPILHSGTTHQIIGGKHPMVDAGLQDSGRHFTANDCSIGDQSQVLLVTGPNMGGKSTFLQQNALISILAQTGCYVPAEYASIGLVDKIFSRIGSADSLANHQSTFMVEMLEVADILNQATSRSFVVIDEVGRGTTPEDGIAVGYACLEHLHNKNRCRTLFATHFHSLADMTRKFERLACYCTDAEEDADGSWVYVHKLRQGVNRESHALKVARLAGLPEDAIKVAEDVLVQLKVPTAVTTHGD